MRLLSLIAALFLVSDVSAGPLRNRRAAPQQQAEVPLESGKAASEALDEVNAARAARGLRPFIRDDGLTQAARVCAETRARWGIRGHLGGSMSDFAAIPAGSSASAAGAGALEPSWGWAACATYENWTYAGAAISIGHDGRRYMSLFVR